MGANGVFKWQNNNAVVPKFDPITITTGQAQWKTVMVPRGCWHRPVAVLTCFVPFLEPHSNLFCL